MDAATVVGELEAVHPLAALLARWTCLPVRIAPAFLRLARLRLLPQAGTGDEADLWLSDLVESRSGAGFSLRPAVRAWLRESLRADPAALDEVWERVHREHAPWLSPRARLEEELTWRLLRDAQDVAIETLWAAVVRELDAGPNAEGVARWVTRAVPDLPPGTLLHPSGRLAWHGAHLVLGDASVLGEDPQEFLDTGAFAFATRRLPRQRVWIGLAPQGLMISAAQPIEHGHEIEVPATRPLWLQVEDHDASPPAAPVALTFDTASIVRDDLALADRSSVVFRLIDGALYRLTPGVAEERSAASRPRTPKVEIEYEAELYGSVLKRHLPFVVGVLADLSGHPVEPLPPLEDRKFLEIDVDNFETRMASLRPRLRLMVEDHLGDEGTLAVDLSFRSWDDWTPAGLVRQVAPLQQWEAMRSALEELEDALRDGRFHSERLYQLLADDAMMKRLSDAVASLAWDEPQHPAPTEQMVDELAKRLGIEDVKLRTPLYRGAVALAHMVALRGTKDAVSPDVLRGLEYLSAQMLKARDKQIDAILHHADFQRLEGAWRGLDYLVRRTETSEMMKIRFLNASKADLAAAAAAAPELFGDPLTTKVYHQEFEQLGGEPYGLLVGDYDFSHHAQDVALLERLASIAAVAFAPFVAAASPQLLGMENWLSVNTVRDVALVQATPEYEAWWQLRKKEDALYCALVLPRMIARQPWRAGNGLAGYAESTSDTPSSFTWCSSAYALATNITRAFVRHGWCAEIQRVAGGGLVDIAGDENSLEFPERQLLPADVVIDERRGSELRALGLSPLLTLGAGRAVFNAVPSLHAPATYDDPDATANARLVAQWQNLLPCCRFMHYLKCLLRDKAGSFHSEGDEARFLNDWIRTYVHANPTEASPIEQARRPLAAAEVVIAQLRRPDYPSSMTVYLRPHYQLGELAASMRLVTDAPTIPR